MRRKISTKRIAAARSGSAQCPGVWRAKTTKNASRKPRPQPKKVRAMVTPIASTRKRRLAGLRNSGIWLRTCSMSEDLGFDAEGPAADQRERQAGDEGDDDVEPGRDDEGFQVPVVVGCDVVGGAEQLLDA